MLLRLLIPFSLLLLFACSGPHEPVDDIRQPAENKWSDLTLREIHDHKNNRNTSALISFLGHTETFYRAEAAMALGSVQDTVATMALSEAIHDSEPEVRLMAAFALGQLRSESAAKLLIELISSDTTTTIRTEALEALGKCNSPDAADFLKTYTPQFLFDESGQAWGIYHLALNELVDNDHVRIMSAGLFSELDEIRLAATHFFSRHTHALSDEGKRQLLLLAAADREAEVRMAAADALGHHDLPQRTEVLSELVIYDQHPGVRVNAIRSLTNIKEGAETVAEALFDGNPNVAVAAAEYFSSNPQMADIDRLRQQIVAHPVGSVRGALFAAAIKQSDNRIGLLNEFRNNLTSIKRVDLAIMVPALQWAPEAAELLDSLIFTESPEVATNAFIARWKQMEKENLPCDQWEKFVNRMLVRGDYGQLAAMGSFISADHFQHRGCLNNIVWEENMTAIELPEGLEAWLELNRARTAVTGKPLLPEPQFEFLEIDWERLEAAGPQPEIMINTTRGVFNMILLAEDAPATVSHLLELIDEAYFNEKSFHRVVPNFVVQTGCPRGDGYGSGEVLLPSEFSPLHYGPGVAGMASAGKDTESTQWFITHRTTPHLDGRYTIFGAVTEGMDVVWNLTPSDRIVSVEFRPAN